MQPMAPSKSHAPLVVLITYMIVYVAPFLSILKLTGMLHWKWVWVLSPAWVPIAIIFAIIVGLAMLVGAGIAVVAFLDSFRRTRARVYTPEKRQNFLTLQ